MSKGKLLAVCLVWLFIFAALAATWKFFVQPWRQQAAEDRQRTTIDSTSSTSQYRATVHLSLDSFSGYAVLRSAKFREELSQKKIKVELVDDQADYVERIEALAKGDVQMAAFPVDALINVLAERDDQPATIVAVLDESRGADAMVGYREVFPDVDSLNRPETRIVATLDSPSETLARVMMDRFSFDRLSGNPFVGAKDAPDVVKLYRDSRPDAHDVYVLWEPYVSQMLSENDKLHKILGSEEFRGKIVDCLVVSRDYLVKHEAEVQDVVACYFRAAYDYRDSMESLVISDGKSLGTPLSAERAKALVDGIWWKNTQENFAHLGLRPAGSIQLLEDMITDITQVLLRTKAIGRDPTGGKPTILFYDKLLAHLQSSDFHPGISSETLRDDQVKLPDLSEQQWNELVPVGTLSINRLVFPRGRSDLTESSQATLDQLAKDLQNWPRYYLIVQGNAALAGDSQANQTLAGARAKAAEEYLVEAGVAPNRVRAVAGKPSGSTSVTFKLGELPY
ncbi:MAG: phosphate ABC transporter substrate-binding/OmpA family protein [Pirellulaceae bacterium]|nr:OmpA family protein [Planctomycetales bacterium]